MFAKWHTLTGSKKRKLMIDSGLEAKHITRFDTETLPLSQMNPTYKHRIVRLMLK